MRVYMEFAKKAFQNSIVYRANSYAGIINTIVMIFVNIAIWRAIYEEEAALEGLQFRLVMTYIVLSFLMQSVFVMDEYLIQGKVRNGTIATDMLRPVSFLNYIFSHNIGIAVFRIIIQLIPALIVSILFIKILPPFSPLIAVYFAVSVILGYLVLYSINLVVWLTSFWYFEVFSFVTIKDAAIMILSGALMPIWFMPGWMYNIVQVTPFGSIYSVPISIYLGQLPETEMYTKLVLQLVWIIVFQGIARLMWHCAVKRIVVQGG
ncbi:MAG: ABC transporter permease [Acetivibrionales bacterium]